MSLNLTLARHPTKKVDFLEDVKWYRRTGIDMGLTHVASSRGCIWAYNPVSHEWLNCTAGWKQYVEEDSMFGCLGYLRSWPRCAPPADVRNEPWNT